MWQQLKGLLRMMNVEKVDGDFKLLPLNVPKRNDVRDEKYGMRGLRITKLSAAVEPLNSDVQLQWTFIEPECVVVLLRTVFHCACGLTIVNKKNNDGGTLGASKPIVRGG
jgi:hypothetical protein